MRGRYTADEELDLVETGGWDATEKLTERYCL